MIKDRLCLRYLGISALTFTCCLSFCELMSSPYITETMDSTTQCDVMTKTFVTFVNITVISQAKERHVIVKKKEKDCIY